MSAIKKPKNSRDSEKILITGGCGFIGVNLINYLLKRDFKYIRILDNLITGNKKNLEDVLQENGKIIPKEKDSKVVYNLKNVSKKNIEDNTIIELITDDIRNFNVCLQATENINSVMHLAAHAGVMPSIKDPFFDFEVNVKGTLNLLYAAVENRVDKFIFASSNAPLGNQTPPMDENKIPKPLSPYGSSKLACEGYCSAFYNSYGLKTVMLRFSNVYGPYCLHKNSVIAKFIKDGLIKKTLTVYGSGQQTRDFIHVDDICQAIFLCLNSPRLRHRHSDTIWGEIFLLGTRRETTINELADYIKILIKNNIQIIYEPERKGEIKKNYSEIKKAKAMLGFKPEVTLEEGIKNVYEWFINQGLDKIKKAKALSESE
jgi:UDP-glucose 4-epimerase